MPAFVTEYLKKMGGPWGLVKRKDRFKMPSIIGWKVLKKKIERQIVMAALLENIC